MAPQEGGLNYDDALARLAGKGTCFVVVGVGVHQGCDREESTISNISSISYFHAMNNE